MYVTSMLTSLAKNMIKSIQSRGMLKESNLLKLQDIDSSNLHFSYFNWTLLSHVPAMPIVNPFCQPLAQNICLMFANAVFILNNRAPVRSYNMMKTAHHIVSNSQICL